MAYGHKFGDRGYEDGLFHDLKCFSPTFSQTFATTILFFPDFSLTFTVFHEFSSNIFFHVISLISMFSRCVATLLNKEQIITGYQIDGIMGSSGGGRVRKLTVVCLHNNAIVARCILVTLLHCRTPEPRLSAIYNIVSSV